MKKALVNVASETDSRHRQARVLSGQRSGVNRGLEAARQVDSQRQGGLHWDCTMTLPVRASSPLLYVSVQLYLLHHWNLRKVKGHV